MSRVPSRPVDVQWRQFGTEAVVLNPRTGDYCQLNDTGALIWSHVDGQRTVRQIAAALASHLSCAPEDIVDDVDSFVGELAQRQFLTLH